VQQLTSADDLGPSSLDMVIVRQGDSDQHDRVNSCAVTASSIAACHTSRSRNDTTVVTPITSRFLQSAGGNCSQDLQRCTRDAFAGL